MAATEPAQNTLAIPVPKTRSDGASQLEIRARRVESWLQSVSEARPSKAAEQIHQTLFTQNRINLDPENRLQIVETFREPVMKIVVALQQGLQTAPHPLSDRNFRHVVLADALLEEMANAYKLVAVQIGSAKRTKSQQADLIVSIQRAVSFLSRGFFNAYIGYTTVPRGRWHEIHELYRFAEAEGLRKRPVAGGTDQHSARTINDSYLEALLIAACNPYGLLQGDCTRLQRLLGDCFSYAELGDGHDVGDDTVGRFTVDLGSDSPPTSMHKNDALDDEDMGRIRVLNALSLLREVHQRTMATMIANGNDAADTELDLDLLRRVSNVWSGKMTHRQFKRTEDASDVIVCAGIRSVHYHASRKKRFAEIVDIGTPGRRRSASAESENAPYSIAQVANRSSVMDEEMGPTLQVCRTVNESAAGLCLRIEPESKLEIRTGEVLGVKYPLGEHWQIGVVRWCSETNRVMYLGVQFLAPEVRSVLVKESGNSKSESTSFSPALFLPAKESLRRPESIILPRARFSEGQTLSLVTENHSVHRITPLHLLGRSGSYDQRLFALHGKRVVAPEESGE